MVEFDGSKQLSKVCCPGFFGALGRFLASRVWIMAAKGRKERESQMSEIGN